MKAIGSLVRLRSGSPVMTVANTEHRADGEIVIVEWFSGEQLRRGAYSADMLVDVLTADFEADAVNRARFQALQLAVQFNAIDPNADTTAVAAQFMDFLQSA